ncbi:hypothetical protein JCM10212_004793 [Sporobolomyces blumeae]
MMDSVPTCLDLARQARHDAITRRDHFRPRAASASASGSSSPHLPLVLGIARTLALVDSLRPGIVDSLKSVLEVSKERTGLLDELLEACQGEVDEQGLMDPTRPLAGPKGLDAVEALVAKGRAEADSMQADCADLTATRETFLDRLREQVDAAKAVFDEQRRQIDIGNARRRRRRTEVVEESFKLAKERHRSQDRDQSMTKEDHIDEEDEAARTDVEARDGTKREAEYESSEHIDSNLRDPDVMPAHDHEAEDEDDAFDDEDPDDGDERERRKAATRHLESNSRFDMVTRHGEIKAAIASLSRLNQEFDDWVASTFEPKQRAIEARIASADALQIEIEASLAAWRKFERQRRDLGQLTSRREKLQDWLEEQERIRNEIAGWVVEPALDLVLLWQQQRLEKMRR